VLVITLPSVMFFLGLLLGRRAAERDQRRRPGVLFLEPNIPDDVARRFKTELAKAIREQGSASDGPTNDNPRGT